MAVLEKLFVLGKKVPNQLPSIGGHPVTRLISRIEIHNAIDSALPASVAWIASDLSSGDTLLEGAVARATGLESRRRRLGKLVLMEAPRRESLVPAERLFSSVVWTDQPQHWLALPEMVGVLGERNPQDYLIGGIVDLPSKSLTVHRGDMTRLVVPLSIFRPTGEGVEPNPADFEVIDNGLAIRLGSYEATADSIFYETDPKFRKRWLASKRDEEKTFGASLRRLRLQRGLRQSDFRPLPEKTIARIETNKVQKPHGQTLAVIARRLGVAAGAIETY